MGRTIVTQLKKKQLFVQLMIEQMVTFLCWYF